MTAPTDTTVCTWPLQSEQATLWLEALPAPNGQALRWDAMREASLAAVMRIEQAAHSHPWTQGQVQGAVHSDDLTQLLCAGDEPVGYFIAMVGVDEVHLLNITVAPEWQGQGLGKCMLNALARWAQQLGKPQIWLEVRRSNAPAIAAYLRFGFEQVGVRKAYYPDTPTTREDAIVMTLNLPRPTQPLEVRP